MGVNGLYGSETAACRQAVKKKKKAGEKQKAACGSDRMGRTKSKRKSSTLLPNQSTLMLFSDAKLLARI